MKRILLAKKGKRILSKFIDVIITCGLTLFIFFVFVFPKSLDTEQLNKNGNEITSLYKESGLFVVDDNGNYNANCAFSEIKKVTDLYSITLKFNGKEYTNVSLTDSLYSYYTTKFINYGSEYNLSIEKYKSDILKVNTAESNILDYDEINNKLVLIDSTKEEITVKYFLDIYSKACKNLISNSHINDLTVENQKIFLEGIKPVIYVLFFVSLIFELIIPLCSPCCETIGKHILKIGVIQSDGYKLKKQWLIPRWITYVLVELVFGILTFGATVLITYTMFLFCKNRRCLHDFIGKSVVIEKDGSIYFSSAEEEKFYIENKSRWEAE